MSGFCQSAVLKFQPQRANKDQTDMIFVYFSSRHWQIMNSQSCNNHMNKSKSQAA